MSQRFILEVSASAGHLRIYDLDGRELLNEVSLPEGLAIPDRLAALADAGTERSAPETGSATPAPVPSHVSQPRPMPNGSATSIDSFSTQFPLYASDGTLSTLVSSASSETIEFYQRPLAPLESKRPGRRKLWDIEHKYHCPIIGTCLTVDELRRLSKQHVWRTQGPPNDYEIHVSFVAAAVGRNTLSLTTHKLLEKKYASTVRRYQQASQTMSLLDLWSDSLASGEVPGALWALMTHPKADQATLATVYEDVHMLSHQIGAGQRADLKRLTETRTELARLQQKFDQLQRRIRQQVENHDVQRMRLDAVVTERASECERLTARVQDLTRQLAEIEAAQGNETWFALNTEAEELRSRLLASDQLVATWNQRWREGQDSIQRLEAAYREKDAECQALERLLVQEMLDPCDDCPNDACAVRADLAGRLVLCVGGHKPLVEKYRQLVALCNGRFDHHDGGMEDNQRRLESMLASADAVVCAADYVSHSAYYRTKRFCKRVDKPHVLLGNSGISAFARALERMAN
jgi:hypothetical protein